LDWLLVGWVGCLLVKSFTTIYPSPGSLPAFFILGFFTGGVNALRLPAFCKYVST
jgi:ABC-type uncharacterized transport system permease subunit